LTFDRFGAFICNSFDHLYVYKSRSTYGSQRNDHNTTNVLFNWFTKIDENTRTTNDLLVYVMRNLSVSPVTGFGCLTTYPLIYCVRKVQPS